MDSAATSPLRYTKTEITLLVFAMQSAHSTGGRTREDLIQALRGYINSRGRMIKVTRNLLKVSSLAKYPATQRTDRITNINEQIKGRQAQQRRARRILKKMAGR